MFTSLPDLPRTKKKKEAEFGITFRHWCETNSQRFDGKDTFELKDTRGKDYLNFNEIKAVQLAMALKCASDEGCLIRVSVGTTGTSDYILLRKAYPWVVIKYPKNFYIISVNALIQEKETSARKSLTSEAARRIAWLVV